MQTSDNIGGNEMVDISALKKEYPWFSVLYQLEAKCLKNDNKFGLKKSIKTASLFTGDREVLYNFMHDAISFGNLTAAETLSPVKPIEKKEIQKDPKEPKPAIVTQVSKPQTKPVAPDKKEIAVSSKEVEEVKRPAEEVVANKKKGTTPKEPKPTIAYDPLIELQSKVIKEESQPTKPTKTYNPLIELPKLEEKATPKKRDKQDFFSWLDSLDDEQTKEEPKPRKLKMSAEASQLLENFIKNRPSISRIRTDIDRTEIHKVDRENVESEIVTESLAALHVKQGRPENAIDIYEKLRLQNPQKFSYFAALIEKIKKDNNLE